MLVRRLVIVPRHILLLLLSCLAFGCHKAEPPASSANARIAHPGFEWLNDADPERDLDAALARGDRRFIQCMGVGAYTPRVDHSEPLVKQRGVRPLGIGATDYSENEEHYRAIQKALDYAQEYNTLLLQKLKDAKPDA